MTGHLAMFRTHLLLWLAVGFGGGTLLVFLWFLLAGPPGWVELGLPLPMALTLDAGLCLAFFVQHSGMIRKSFRLWLARFAPPSWHGAIYALASGFVLLILLSFWQESGAPLAPPPAVRWWLRAAAFASLVGLFWALRALPSLDLFGTGSVVHEQRGVERRSEPLRVRGPYRWVRHPMYFFALVLIWSYPFITADRLLFNLLWTIWVWVGTVLEERDLVRAFGEPYVQYQRDVPMLIPRRIPQRPETPIRSDQVDQVSDTFRWLSRPIRSRRD